jgi:hypothetical protein
VDRDHQDGLIGLLRSYRVERLVVDLQALARGRVGVSSTFSRLDEAHHARREAGLAAASASPGTTEVVRFEQRPLAVLLAGTPEGAHALARSVLGTVLDLPSQDRQVVLQTARTWLACPAPRPRPQGSCTSTATRCATGSAGSNSSVGETSPPPSKPPSSTSRSSAPGSSGWADPLHTATGRGSNTRQTAWHPLVNGRSAPFGW